MKRPRADMLDKAGLNEKAMLEHGQLFSDLPAELQDYILKTSLLSISVMTILEIEHILPEFLAGAVKRPGQPKLISDIWAKLFYRDFDYMIGFPQYKIDRFLDRLEPVEPKLLSNGTLIYWSKMRSLYFWTLYLTRSAMRDYLGRCHYNLKGGVLQKWKGGRIQDEEIVYDGTKARVSLLDGFKEVMAVRFKIYGSYLDNAREAGRPNVGHLTTVVETLQRLSLTKNPPLLQALNDMGCVADSFNFEVDLPGNKYAKLYFVIFLDPINLVDFKGFGEKNLSKKEFFTYLYQLTVPRLPKQYMFFSENKVDKIIVGQCVNCEVNPADQQCAKCSVPLCGLECWKLHKH